MDVETEFTEYGVDSIMMMNILNHMEKQYAQALDPNIILNNPTIKFLAAYLIDEGIVSQKKFILSIYKTSLVNSTNKYG